MPLLTVRLTDEEYAALKALAAGSSMADLVRRWIASGLLAPAVPPRTTISGQFGASRPAPKPAGKKR